MTDESYFISEVIPNNIWLSDNNIYRVIIIGTVFEIDAEENLK
jgi:hypothetical protein